MLRPFRLAMAKDLPQDATMRVIRQAEWMSPVWRLANVIGLFVYPLNSATIVLMGILVVVNAVLLRACFRGVGPMTRGPRGQFLDALHSAAAMSLVGALLPDGTCFSIKGSFPLFGYAHALVVLYAFAVRKRRFPVRRVVAIVSVVGTIWVGTAFLNGYNFRTIDWSTMAFQSIWLAAAIGIGRLLFRIGSSFSENEVAIVRSEHEGFADWIHSDLIGDMTTMRVALKSGAKSNGGLVPIGLVEDAIEEISIRTRRKQLEELLAAKRGLVVPLTTVLRYHKERFGKHIRLQVPPVGGWDISIVTALAIHRTLDDVFNVTIQSRAVRAVLRPSWDPPHFQLDISVVGEDPTRLAFSREGGLAYLTEYLTQFEGTLAIGPADLAGRRLTLRLPEPPVISADDLQERATASLHGLLEHHRQRFGMVLDLKFGPVDEMEIPVAAARAIDRVFGDLLSNVVAAGATYTSIEVEVVEDDLVVTIGDNGPGIPDNQILVPGGSLARLKEHLHEMGGSLSSSSSQRGTTMSVRIPLRTPLLV